MARKQTFLTALWSESWKESYAELSADQALVEQRKITPREAYMKASNKARFEGMIEEGT